MVIYIWNLIIFFATSVHFLCLYCYLSEVKMIFLVYLGMMLVIIILYVLNVWHWHYLGENQIVCSFSLFSRCRVWLFLKFVNLVVFLVSLLISGWNHIRFQVLYQCSSVDKIFWSKLYHGNALVKDYLAHHVLLDNS